MKTINGLSVLAIAVATLLPAFPVLAKDVPHAAAPARTVRPPSAPAGRSSSPRSVGLHVVPHPGQPVHPVNNPPHQVVVHNASTGKDENHPVIVDQRPGHVVDRDAHLRIAGRGYRPLHNWDRWDRGNGGWWQAWGIGSWDTVGTVSCEAANETTGELYPVSEDRDANGWDDPAVNLVLDQALDDCMAEAGGNSCGPATPACTFQNY